MIANSLYSGNAQARAWAGWLIRAGYNPCHHILTVGEASGLVNQGHTAAGLLSLVNAGIGILFVDMRAQDGRRVAGRVDPAPLFACVSPADNWPEDVALEMELQMLAWEWSAGRMPA